jgi:hypothetical protein
MVLVIVFVIVRMRVRDLAVGMLVGMLCAGGRHDLVGVVVMPVIMGMFMGVCDRAMRVRVRVSGHRNLLCRPNRRIGGRTQPWPANLKSNGGRFELVNV